MTVTPDAPHDELRCQLWRDEQAVCTNAAVVSVVSKDGGDATWGCERHAGEALDALDGGRISQVGDWDAARRLLELPWNQGRAIGF